jgi:hypothetical protein
MEQSYYAPPAPSVTEEANNAEEVRNSLENAAAEFSKNVQDATGKLVAAAESFSSMSSGLSAAVSEVKDASVRATEAQKAAEDAKAAAEEAKSAAEAVQAKMDRDYANLKGLMSDLQERIGALAVLARPFAMDPEPQAPAIQDESETENFSPSSSEGLAPAATENAPSPAGWQGWQG